MKAKDEGEALQHMAAAFEAGGGLLSGSNDSWVQAKVRALKHMDLHAQKLHGRLVDSILDIGVGDMRHLEAWGRFDDIHYTGVDGCSQVVAAAQARHPERLFVEEAFSALVQGHLTEVMPPDAILLLDVLYHLPSAELEAELLDYVYSSPAEYIILSHATDVQQTFDQATGVGGAGFCWFARPWTLPPEWNIVHMETGTGAPQKQRLVVLARS